MIVPLICNMRARDIPPVLVERNKLEFDQLWINYIASFGEYSEAYQRMRNLFLNDERFKKYTHLVIAPDDLIVTNDHIRALVKDLEEFDYPVLSGICNVDMSYDKNNYAICSRNLPNPNWDDGSGFNRQKLRRYDWETDKSLEGKKIIRVLFSGFPLIFIRRDIVERINFETDAASNEHNKKAAGSLDTMFCQRCFEQSIPIHADCTVRMTHLRNGGLIKVGMKHKSISWIQYNKKDGSTLRETVFFEKLTTPRLVAALSVKDEEQFIGKTFQSLLQIKDLDAVYVKDGSYMKDFHKTSDSIDGTKAICNMFKQAFKEFYFMPAMGKYFDSQSQKRNELFAWIEQFDYDGPIWILVIDGDEEIKFRDQVSTSIELKPLIQKYINDIVLMETYPNNPTANHPLAHTGVRLFRARQGIHWDPEYTMRYVNSNGDVLVDYSPNMNIIATPHHFLKEIILYNHWAERPFKRIDDKKKFLKQRAETTKERRGDLQNV